MRHKIALLAVFALMAMMVVPGTATLAEDPSCSSKPVGLLGHAPSVGGDPVAIDVQGDFAYVGDWTSRNASRGTFQVFDVSDPCNPVRLSGDLWLTQELPDIEVIGDLAYLANDRNGFVVYNVQDPSNPTYVEGRSDGTYAVSLEYDGGQYAFMGYTYTAGRELAIYDMNTFPGDGPIATYDGLGSRHVEEVDVVGDRAYVLSANGPGYWFEVVDISVLTSPTRVGEFLFAVGWEYGVPRNIEVRDGFAYVATRSHAPTFRHGVVVIDLADEANPTMVGFGESGVSPGLNGEVGLDVVGDIAYLAAPDGLTIIDVGDPFNPTIVDTWPYPADFVPSRGGRVAVREHLAFVTSIGNAFPRVGGLAIYKLYEPNEEPDCSAVYPSLDMLWPPSHEFVPIDVVGVTDPDGDEVAITVDSIFQDEFVDSTGDGAFAPDGQGVGTTTAEVRAERSGPGNGRYYHISFTANDGQGGSCSGVVQVGVSKNQGKKGAPVDDGALYDSTIIP